MIVGGRQAILDALAAAAPAIVVRFNGAPDVDVPTLFVALASAEPDPTQCSHTTTFALMLISQFTDPELSGPALDAAADAVIDALHPDTATFVSAEGGNYLDVAPSMLLTFATRQ